MDIDHQLHRIPPLRHIFTAMTSLLATLSILAFLSPLSPVSASSVTTLKAKARAIANQINADNTHLSSISSTYLSEGSLYDSTKARAAELEIKIARVKHLVIRDRKRVQRALVDAYVEGGLNSAAIFSWSNNPNTQISSSTYLGVATGELAQATAQFTGDEHDLSISLSTQEHNLTIESAAFDATAAARDQVLTTVAAEQSLYSSTNHELNTLVQQEEAAAQAAQAAQAAAAARASASASASARTAAGPPSAIATVATVPTGTPPPTTLAGEFAAIRNCESGGDYSLNTGNGYYGAYQFAAATWTGLGESGLPSSAPASTQDAAAFQLYQRAGDSFTAWPTCAAIIGLG
jgi:hypothetical protein